MPSHYVAVGASAGGLEAIESFFTAMPAESSCAFIVIQHLSPDYKSLMVEILSKKTKMAVHRAEDGMLVEAANIYLIPPKQNLTIFHGKLFLNPQDPIRGINLPIDIFLRSLADDQGEKAVAVILSGTGSDGMRGTRAVKQFGGMIMVQDEESARFDGMPRSAISTGLADFILPPEQMPEQLLSFVQSPHGSKQNRSKSIIENEDGLSKIFALLRDQNKVDFTHYKPSTVTRRIERRMTVNRIDEIDAYVDYLRRFPSEIQTLFRELLIGVTSFFRDQKVFDYLEEKVMEEIITAGDDRELRFWVAGCSTGEEAYSLAILIRETLNKLEVKRNVKIFATDIDREAIHFAAIGSYPESIVADLPIPYVTKYFVRRDDHFQIARNIREMVVFAQHNLIKDPPFTNIDFISCRNLLIYLQPVLQSKVFSFFNFSLRSDGVLLLGSSESTGDMVSFFEPVEPKLKIFKSRGKQKQIPSNSGGSQTTDTRYRELHSRYSNSRRLLQSGGEKILDRFLDAVNRDFLPVSVIVNEQMEVLHFIGDSSRYFQIPTGTPTLEIDKLARKELSIPLSTGLQKVFRQKKELRFSGITLKEGDTARQINLRMMMLPGMKGQSPLAAVMIIEIEKERPEAAEKAVESYNLSEETEQRIRDLEQELQFSRENLQATIEELETSNEELQATNEELLASNEELQSTNEELQSTNEELYTVNTEYHSKIIELTELNNDVDNLLGATDIGNLLLDENLDVRRFSRKVTQVFKLIESDIGRPIGHISHFLKDFDPVSKFTLVADTHKAEEWEVETKSDEWYLMRVVPYLIGPETYSGVVASFVKISRIREAERELQDSQLLFKTAFNSSPSLVWLSDTTKMCTWFNKTWLDFTGRTMEEELGVGWTEGVHKDDYDRCLKIYHEAFDKQEPFAMEYRLRHKSGEYRWISDEGTPLFDTQGNFIGYIGSCLDINEHKEIKKAYGELMERVKNG